MYVCLCNGYREAEIREVAEEGIRCAREAYYSLGNGPCCGTCLDYAQAVVDSVHAENGTPASLPAPQQAPARQPRAPRHQGEADEAVLMAAE